SGHTRVYQFNGADWDQLGNDINGEAAGDWSGWSVSLNGDGTVLAVGARNNDGNGADSGHTRVYQFNGVNWSQLGQDIDGEAAGDWSGYSVVLSSNGNSVAIGAYLNDDNGLESGQVRVYQYNGAMWNQLGQDIEGEVANDTFGWSVGLSGDGSVVAGGAPYHNGNGFESGRVRAYRYTDPYTQIPDPNFEQALIDQAIDSEGLLNGLVLTSDISGIISLDVYNLGIMDMTGIEDFASLVNLRCDANLLTSLSVSSNSNLRRLYCQNNQLSGSVDLRGLGSLLIFNAVNNPALSCVEVDDAAAAVAGTGIYANWAKDLGAMYSENCGGMMAKSGTTKTDEDVITVASENMTVYPNPAKEKLYITLPPGKEIINVTIFTIQGERKAVAKSTVISVTQLAGGVYFVAIQTSDGRVSVKKVIVSGEQ
ncbi:MAG: T9SS type A sorting domain-containing protein, partial [Sinomicrobium sp.]|nr:T9SS type A sorting domain-containing protein [Sinomicrobium sp.]